MAYIFQIIVYLRSHGSTISMAEIEIWVREDPEETEQTPYCNGDGAAYLIPSEDDKTVYTFDTVSLQSLFLESLFNILIKKALKGMS